MSHDSVVLLCAVSCVTPITGVEMGLLMERSLVVADALLSSQFPTLPRPSLALEVSLNKKSPKNTFIWE